MMYAMMYKKRTMSEGSIQSGIISFRELSAGLKTVKANGHELLDSETLFHFEEELKIVEKHLKAPPQPSPVGRETNPPTVPQVEQRQVGAQGNTGGQILPIGKDLGWANYFSTVFVDNISSKYILFV